MVAYTDAPTEIVTIAQELITTYHEHLKEARIGFIFREEAAVSGGKKVWGKARKPPAWFRVFHDLDFLIEIAEDIYSDLDAEQRKALIDHELCHCGWSDGPYMVSHDIEEFNAIIERYGDWSFGVAQTRKSFAKSEQLALKGIDPKPEREGTVKAIDPKLMNNEPMKEDDDDAWQQTSF